MKSILTRRQAIRNIGLGTAGLVAAATFPACSTDKRHIITLSFDDGFEKSSIKTADIYEKYSLSACINVIATAHLKTFKLPNEYHAWKVGDFGLWNDLKSRGHEIMPHSYDHQDLTKMPLEEARTSILNCLDVFNRELKGFNAGESIYNFAYNASTPEIEKWLVTQVKAFRTGGPVFNPLPYAGQTKLTCISYGPDNCDKYLNGTVNAFLEGPPGWFIFNTHGLDDEGWGPLSSTFLDELLDRLIHTKTVKVMPPAAALNSVA